MTLRPLLGLPVVVLLAVAGGPSVAAVDLRNVLNEYSLTSWGIKDGLPSSEVLAIAQDADGFLWLGTDGGLVRFDGTRFTVQAGVPAGRSVRALLVTRAGDLWAGLGESGGVLRYRRVAPGERALVADPASGAGLGAGAVRALAEDRDGTVWLGHLGGLFRYAEGRWISWQAEGLDHDEIHALVVDARGRLIAGTRRGVRMATTADRRVFTALDRTVPRDEAVQGVSVDAEGHVWRSDGVHGFQGRVADRRPIRPAEIARGTRLLHDRAGHLWVGTGGQGLWRVSQRAGGRVVVEQSTVTTGLLGNGVMSVYEDRDGNVWAGTLDGLNRLTRFVATPVQGLGLVSGLEVSPQGIWVMTAESLRLFPRGGSIDGPVVAHHGEVRAIHADENGRLWMSTGDRLYWFDERGRHDATPLVRGLGAVALLASDRRGGLWLYDAALGLHRRPSEPGATVRIPDRLQRARLTWMDTARDGTLWLSTNDGGLARIDPDGRSTEYAPGNGLEAGTVRAWHLAADGTLWLGGADGLTRFQAGRFATAREAHGHPFEQVTAIIEAGDGQLWTGTRAGLLRVTAADLHRHLEAPGDPVPLAFINKGDGLAGNPRWYGHRGAVLDGQRRLWFVTSRGLSVVDPAGIAAPRAVDASVDTILVDGQVTTPPLAATLPPGTRRLDIQFAALALTAPSTIRFRYRLEGFDAGWVDAGARRHASYTNLVPGPYRFHVMATDTDGTWPDRAAVWAFDAAPMFYQTAWFMAACVLSLLGAVAAAWRMHLRRVRAEMSILLAERARMAREIHDTLLQGLFGVALRCDAIAADVEASAPQVSRQFLDLRRGVEQYVREARQSILGLRSPALQDLGLAAALRATGEQLTAGSPVRFTFEATGTWRPCLPHAEEHLLRIGQEALTNAVRHAHSSTVRAELHYRADGLVLQVCDDGQGVDPEVAARAGGLGLASMRERAQAAGGSVHIRSAAGQGTRVEVKLPYERRHAAA
jgi:signal transduction histidine kinase/ligand-binding sensor domain-containing protein